MSNSHGVAIVCEREGGHTVAWVDDDISIHVPAGYFVETWPQDRETHVGTLADGYFRGRDQWGIKYSFGDWYDAVVWCRDDDRKRQRKEQAA